MHGFTPSFKITREVIPTFCFGGFRKEVIAFFRDLEEHEDGTPFIMLDTGYITTPGEIWYNVQYRECSRPIFGGTNGS